MAHVSNKPRCDRCKEFRPTSPTRVGSRVVRMCVACQLEVGWTDAATASPREPGPRARSPGRTSKRVVAPPPGFKLPEDR